MSNNSEENKNEQEQEQKINADSSTFDKSQVAQAGRDVNQKIDFKQFFLGDAETVFFSFRSTPSLTKDQLASIGSLFVYPPDRLNDLISCLRDHRMLLLTGEDKTGKYFTAKYLCFHLMEEDKRDYDVRCIDPLSQRVRISISELIDDQNDLKEKILIFKDAFSKKNQCLLDFFHDCSRDLIDHISRKLADLDSFILFTSDTGNYEKCKSSEIHIEKNISIIDRDLLQKGFDLNLKQFCSLSPARDYSTISQMFEGKKKEIVEKLDRMSKINFFIETYLEKIMSDEKTIADAIEEAGDIRKHLEPWFLKELGMNEKEFETWTFALCLAMFNGISYAFFSEIHLAITKLLLKKMNSFQSFKEFSFTLSETELREKCNAQITRDMINHACRIEFCDPRYQDVLLDILLNNNQKVLMQIVPFLIEYVEQNYTQVQRKYAAFILARIGIIDPGAITFSIIDRWANMEENFYKASVGYLYEGIITSDNKIYFNHCMRKLKAMSLSSNFNEQWAAIAAYKQIGLYNLELAMEELRKIQKEIIDRLLKKKNFLDFLYSHTDLLNDQDILKNLDIIYEETDDLLSAVRYSIVALSINLNPIDVISELRKWIHEGGRNSKVSVVLFFLGIDGILQELGHRNVIIDEGEKEAEIYDSLFLYILATDEEAIKKMTEFFNDLIKNCFSEFRREIKIEFKKILFEHIEKWTLESLHKNKESEAMKKLIVQFYQIGDDEQRDTIWDSINRWQVPKEEDSDKGKDENKRINKDKEEMLHAFVDDVKNRIIKS